MPSMPILLADVGTYAVTSAIGLGPSITCSFGSLSFVGRSFKRFGRTPCECGSADPLLAREVLHGINADNKKSDLQVLQAL